MKIFASSHQTMPKRELRSIYSYLIPSPKLTNQTSHLSSPGWRQAKSFNMEKKAFPLAFRKVIDFDAYLITGHFTKTSKIFS